MIDDFRRVWIAVGNLQQPKQDKIISRAGNSGTSEAWLNELFSFDILDSRF